MSKFILIVAIIYVVYYAVNILYDGFLKKTDVEENKEGDEFVIEDDEQPKKISVEDIAYDEGFSEDFRHYIIFSHLIVFPYYCDHIIYAYW